MRIHWLQHVPFEGLGVIASWAVAREHTLTRTRLWAGEPLPETLGFDWLVAMGGPMGVHDEPTVPWLRKEKEFIGTAIERGKTVLGICLGAQLVALELGARVTANRCKEIGWFPVSRDPGIPAVLAEVLPEEQVVFHWHGDTFALPPGGTRLFSSAACVNQGFILDNRIVGLQFHPEITMHGIAELIRRCRDELRDGEWIQAEEAMLVHEAAAASAQETMYRILAFLEKQDRSPAG